MAGVKERIDALITEQGLAPSREKAKALILAGLVRVDGLRVDKPGTMVARLAKIEIQGTDCPYVSRGGLKLAKALKVFPINLTEKVILDVGASTGGFTDCALKHGAAKAYAVDVGYGQLAWSLRSDPRVICMERTNARYLTHEALGEDVDFVTIDVAFISLDKILPAVWNVIKPTGQVVALIKPQFEAGKEKVGKNGVVRDPLVHREVIQKVLGCAESIGFKILGIDYSPIKGPEGNIEYLAWLGKTEEPSIEWQNLAIEVVANSHSQWEKQEIN